MGTFLEFYDIHKIWSLANYTLLPQIVNNMFQEYLEDLGGQDWVIEEIDIKKQVFCHLWPLQISVVVVIKVWSLKQWPLHHYTAYSCCKENLYRRKEVLLAHQVHYFHYHHSDLFDVSVADSVGLGTN